MLCQECNKVAICRSLCPEAELYVNQDCEDHTDRTIGIPTRICGFPEGLVKKLTIPEITKIQKKLRNLKAYKKKRLKGGKRRGTHSLKRRAE